MVKLDSENFIPPMKSSISTPERLDIDYLSYPKHPNFHVTIEVGATYLIADNNNVSSPSYIHEVKIISESETCFKTVWNDGVPKWMDKTELKSEKYFIKEKLRG